MSDYARAVAAVTLVSLPRMDAAALRSCLARHGDDPVRAARGHDTGPAEHLVARRGTHVWVLGDDDFPIRDARQLDDAPAVLLGEGERPDAFAAQRVAIVGTRAATPHGIADAREIGAFCARAGITVVSGLAIGIDAAAHEGALDAGGLTVGVVATGLDVVYPRRHRTLFARVRERGCIVSEQRYGEPPLSWRFPIRNRIIAALADVVVVVEATVDGGTAHTVRSANDYCRPVFALPGSRRNRAAAGCNQLLLDGAIPLLEPADILCQLGRGGTLEGAWSAPPPRRLTADEGRVLQALAGEPATIDEIERRTKLELGTLGPALRGLEAYGRLRRFRGLWWPC